jgi:hypothetical protein
MSADDVNYAEAAHADPDVAFNVRAEVVWPSVYDPVRHRLQVTAVYWSVRVKVKDAGNTAHIVSV